MDSTSISSKKSCSGEVRGLRLTRLMQFCLVTIFFVSQIHDDTNAQTCCSGGVPLAGSIGLGTAESKRLQFMFTYDHNAINTLVSNNDILEDDSRSRLTQSAIVEFNYGLNKRFSIAAILPFIRQVRHIEAYNNEQDLTRVQGIGDGLLLLKFNMLTGIKHAGTQWVIGLGPKFPTGRTNHTNSNGLTLAADMQPGSGSLDGIVWTYFQYSKFKLANLSLFAVGTYRYSGENKNYNQTQVYRFGNELQLGAGFNYSIFSKWPVELFSSVRYRHQTEDLIDDNIFPSSGGEWVYAIPGFSIDFMPGYSFRFSADLPVYRNLEGTQLTTSYKYTLAMLFSI